MHEGMKVESPSMHRLPEATGSAPVSVVIVVLMALVGTAMALLAMANCSSNHCVLKTLKGSHLAKEKPPSSVKHRDKHRLRRF